MSIWSRQAKWEVKKICDLLSYIPFAVAYRVKAVSLSKSLACWTCTHPAATTNAVTNSQPPTARGVLCRFFGLR